MVAARQNGKLDSRQTHETALDFRAPFYKCISFCRSRQLTGSRFGAGGEQGSGDDVVKWGTIRPGNEDVGNPVRHASC